MGLALAAILMAATAGNAMATEACNPNASDPARFCVDAGLALSTAVATKPVNIDLMFDNTSPAEGSDSNAWLEQATLRLLSDGVPPPAITASSKLPDGLLISGEPTTGALCSSADHFVGCTAGHGTLIGYLSGSGFWDGVKSGDFGIHRIVNLQATPAGVLARYRVAIEGCMETGIPGVGRYCYPQNVEIQIPKAAAGSAVELPIDTRYQVSPTNGVTADIALSSVTLHLGGESSMLEDGTSAGGAFTVIRMPAECGTLSGEGLFEAGDQVRTVMVPSAFAVTGCSKTSLKAVKKAKIEVSGTVKSTVIGDAPVDSGSLAVDLYKKKKHGFKHVAARHPSIDSHGKYKTSFTKPLAKKCKIVTRFAGDAAHAPSKASKTFSCR
jgi:hypothetical protein